MATFLSLRAPLVSRGNIDYANGAFDPGTIAGTVKTQTAPATFVAQFAIVIVIRDHDLVVVRKGQSDPATGAYSFSNLDKMHTYTVEAFHPTKAYRAVVADGVFPT